MVLNPVDSRKSFYCKAYAEREGDGVVVCYSYDTPVAACVDGKIYRLWYGYSATTMRHVDAFADYFAGVRMGKREWNALEVVTLADVRNAMREIAAA